MPEPESNNLLRKILKPAVRLCLRRFLKYNDIVQNLRELIVEMATEELERDGKKVTVSALSVMTGINRRELSRLMQNEGRPTERTSLSGRVLTLWQTDKRFLTKSNVPRQLRYKDEFQELVASVSQDVNPKTLLMELERIGAIEHQRGKVKVLTMHKSLHTDPAQGLGLLTRNIDLLSESVEENLFHPRETRNHHMHTEFDNIFEDEIPMIREWLFEQGALFHKKMRDYLSKRDKDINPDKSRSGGGTVRLCSFSWTSYVKNGESESKLSGTSH